jgi:uncharacterized membrane protein YdjX (TVP38/TMEM64 family)
MDEVPKSGIIAKGSKIKKYMPLLVIGVVFLSFFIFGLDKYLSFSYISENRDRLLALVEEHYVLALIAYFLFYIVAVAASLPGGLLITISGGFLFGWFVGGLVTVFAATIGASILFLVATTSLGDVLRARAGPWLNKLEKGFGQNAFSYLLFLRLVPAFPFWLINIAPAFLGIPLRTYVIATFIGIIPGTFVFAFLGRGLDSIIVEQRVTYEACVNSGKVDCTYNFEVGSLITPEIILSFVALGAISLLPVIVKRFRKV